MRPFLLLSLVLHLVLLVLFWWFWPATSSLAPVRLTIQTAAQNEQTVPGSRSLVVTKEISAASTPLRSAPVERAVSPSSLPTDSQTLSGDSEPGKSEGAGSGEPIIDTLTSGPVVEKPSLIGYPSPGYPREARRKGWEGSVEIEVEVDATGVWTSGRIVRTSGHSALDDAALEALRQARYEPATRNGVPEPGVIDAVVRFRLK